MPDDRDDETAWQPATSEPGEIYTVEGQIRGIGAFARGLARRSRSRSEYRSSMARIAFSIIGIGLAFAAIVILLF